MSISKKNGHRFPCTLLFWRRRKQNTEKVHIIQKVFKQLIYIPLHILELCPYLPVLPVFVSNAASNSYCPYCPYLPVFVSNAASNSSRLMLGVAFKSLPLARVASTVRVRRPPLLAKFWPPPISPDISEKVCPWVASLKF